MSSVVATDLHHYIGDEYLPNLSQMMRLIPGDIKHVFCIFAVLRIAFAFALICFIRKNR